MRRRILGLRTATAAALLVLGTGITVPVQQQAMAADATTDYCQGQCADILPPGENGNATLAEILANQAFGTRPAHSDDQLDPLRPTWPTATGTLTDANHRPTSSTTPPSACRPDQVASTDSPRVGRDDHPGQGDRRPAHHGHHPLRHRVRRRIRGGRGPAVADGPLPARRTRPADLVRRRRPRQPGPRAAVLAAGPVHRGRPPGPDRPARRPAAPRGQQALADAQAYVDGINAYIDKAKTGPLLPRRVRAHRAHRRHHQRRRRSTTSSSPT